MKNPVTPALLLALLFMSHFGMAQRQLTIGATGFVFHVKDSVDRQPLPGVRIILISGKDTLQVVSDEMGVAQLEAHFRSDSVLIVTHHLAYESKTLRLRAPAPRRMQLVHVDLSVSAQELAEIIVVGKALAVVRKGDTIQFNADAFKTFAHDPMAKLFEALPGMRLEDGILTYLGERIHRVTIDGQRLFGDHVDIALENIRADDVADVRVYKEASDQDQLDNTPNPGQMTVADVRTKSKPTVVRRTTVSASGGTPGNSSYFSADALYDLAGKAVFSQVGKTFSVDADMKNVGPYFKYAKKGGNLLFTHEVPNKYRFSTTNRGLHLNTTAQHRNVRDYVAVGNMTGRIMDDSRVSTNARREWNSANSFSYTFPNKDIIGVSGHVSGQFLRSTTMAASEVFQNNQLLQDQTLHQRMRESTPNAGVARLEYSKRLTSGRANIGIHVGSSRLSTDGWRVDTLSAHTSQVHLTQHGKGSNESYGATATYTSSLSQRLSLNLGESIYYIDELSSRTAVDEFTSLADLTNSFDFLIHEVNNKLSAGLVYRNNAASSAIGRAEVDFAWEYRDMQRNDYFPHILEFPTKLHVVSGKAELDYTFSPYDILKFRYSRTPMSVSILDFIPLDDANPLLLRAGNPALKIPVINAFNLNATFISGPATYEVKMGYGLEENMHLERSRYFESETFIPELEYTAIAGATLITKESISGTQNWRLGVDYSVYTNLATIHTGIAYRHGDLKGYVSNHLITSRLDTYTWNWKLKGNFSSRYMPEVASKTIYTTRNNAYEQKRLFSQELGLDMNVMIGKLVEIRNSNLFNWNWVSPTVPGIDRFGVVSNLSMAYFFDDEGRLKLRAEAFDIFDRRQRVSAEVFDDYTATAYSYHIGRYAMAGVVYMF